MKIEISVLKSKRETLFAQVRLKEAKKGWFSIPLPVSTEIDEVKVRVKS